jgi:peptidyl-tRNA hydrolase
MEMSLMDKIQPQERIKVLYRKNLKMSPGKIAAQAVHAALALKESRGHINAMTSVVVLGVSNRKFDEAKQNASGGMTIVRDAGYTEVEPGTETCMAFVEVEP